jgi:hypothetical protein
MIGDSGSIGTNSNSVGCERSGLMFARIFTSGQTLQPSPGIIGEPA